MSNCMPQLVSYNLFPLTDSDNELPATKGHIWIELFNLDQLATKGYKERVQKMR